MRYFAFLWMVLSFVCYASVAMADDWTECSVKVEFSGSSFKAIQRDSKPNKAQKLVLRSACKGVCDRRDKDCVQDCFRKAKFSSYRCFDSHDAYVKFELDVVRRSLIEKMPPMQKKTQMTSQSSSGLLIVDAQPRVRAKGLLSPYGKKVQAKKLKKKSLLTLESSKRKKVLLDERDKKIRSASLLPW